MNRNLPPFLMCLWLSFALAVAGEQAAASRVSMAIMDATSTEMVICAHGESATVRIDFMGKLLPVKSGHSCATCADCRFSASTPMPQNSAFGLHVLSARLASAQPVPTFTPQSPTTPAQARAPPKGL